MSSVTSHTAHSERPERSRNAKAQARHRAKRKAYIEQLEQTVTKLQTALGFSTEQVAALPPPLIKIRELEQDIARLQKENEELRRMLSESGARGPMDLARRNSFTTYQDARNCDRDYKRRKMPIDGVYISPSETPPQGNDGIRPPPLTIPQPLSHHYGNIASNSANHGSSSMFSLHAPAFQMPNTPSGSSATSSPPFSASPAQMQAPSHSPMDHRPSLSNNPHALSGYGQHSYEPVKVEEEGYAPPNHHASHAGHYSIPHYPTTSPENTMDTWHAYSSERAQHLQR